VEANTHNTEEDLRYSTGYSMLITQDESRQDEQEKIDDTGKRKCDKTGVVQDCISDASLRVWRIRRCDEMG
jgi:hypothetical protein